MNADMHYVTHKDWMFAIWMAILIGFISGILLIAVLSTL